MEVIMLKKISLLGLLAFSFGGLHSSTEVPQIAVEEELPSSAHRIRHLGNYMEELSAEGEAFKLWQGSDVLLKFLDLIKESQEFRNYMREVHPLLTKVLETMERKASFNIFSIKIQAEGDLSPIVESVGAGALIRLEREEFIGENETIPTISSLFKNENVLRAALLDFSGAFLKGDIASIFTPVSSSFLSSLSLDYCNLGDLKEECLSHLEMAFRENKTIAHLGLAGNHLGDEGAQVIGRILSENKKLLLLVFGDNDVGPEGAEQIAFGLQENPTLCFLNLAFNNIQDGGAWRFIQLLESNVNLRQVDLRECGITDFSQSRLKSNSKYIMKESLIDIQVLEGLSIEEQGERRRRISSSINH